MFEIFSNLAQHADAAAAFASAAPVAALCAVFSALALLLALRVDSRWGEPPSRWHPVVWMGHYLQRTGALTVRCKPAAAFVLGALAWSAGAAVCGLLAWWLQALAMDQLAWWAALLPGWMAGGLTGEASGTAPGNSGSPDISAVQWLCRALLLAGALAATAALLKCTLSWRMLLGEVRAVEAALGESLPAGRERLSWLVSRDTSSLSAGEVRESAIESLAENLNDSVVAPVFWFVLFGLPGAAVYRFANTADAMWGYPGLYHGHNWQWAGKWAARADDVLSWLPARLTAWLLAASAGGLPWARVRDEARKTPSPNSGWPMGAMALALGVRLGKPGVYALHVGGRTPEPPDTVRAAQLSAAALRRLVVGASLAFAVLAFAVLGCAAAVAGVRALAPTAPAQPAAATIAQ